MSYLIYENVCCLALCEKSFSKRLAFAYLEDLTNEFSTHYGKMVSTAMRPCSCIEFVTDSLTMTNEKCYK
ncbi:UNVERIFIED_CONTAM: sec22b [Trichonephila clavipes]